MYHFSKGIGTLRCLHEYQMEDALDRRIAGLDEVRQLLDGGAWALAITEAYNQARVAALADAD